LSTSNYLLSNPDFAVETDMKDPNTKQVSVLDYSFNEGIVGYFEVKK